MQKQKIKVYFFHKKLFYLLLLGGKLGTSAALILQRLNRQHDFILIILSRPFIFAFSWSSLRVCDYVHFKYYVLDLR